MIEREQSTLLLVDVQEKLLPFINDWQDLLRQCDWLMRLAKTLSVPLLISEQYPKGLGSTVTPLNNFKANDNVMQKVTFSCAADSNCLQQIMQLEREQIILIGIESHVCVMQTALELVAENKQVFVVADCIGSRDPMDHELALARMRQAGVNIVSREMVCFEWLHQAGTDEFRQVSKEFIIPGI